MENSTSNETFIEVVDLNSLRRPRHAASNENRKHTVQCARNGDILNCFAWTLGVKIRTCRTIAISDHEEVLKSESSSPKCDDGCIPTLYTLVDDNSECFLVQMKIKKRKLSDLTISTSSIDCLLNEYDYAELIGSERLNVKEKPLDSFQWLAKEEMSSSIFLVSCKRESQMSVESVFIFEDVPSHRPAKAAHRKAYHWIRCLPLSNSFFIRMEEAFTRKNCKMECRDDWWN